MISHEMPSDIFTLYVLNFSAENQHICTIDIIPPHWHDNCTGSWNLPSCKTRTFLFHKVDRYHCCWWPGDARSQGISYHDTGLVKLGWLCPLTLRVNSLAHGGLGWKFKSIIFKPIILNSNMGTHYETAREWMPDNLSTKKLWLEQLMVWWC